ncbi:Fanconi anemia core complex-associated protein 20 [Orycteropus afer afer]|uniref:Fanconi anemia core complex-associated protein 20 n=1 Tax=Orycteropus afer afer TaxID=1230840 RepID=A0A8B7A8F1_ORYAF|nr:Fanconi anemia core complex-associated protein 20 [Orycteropus afer afer]
MAAEAGGGRRSRLRLSRRRPPSEARPPSGRPWFLQEIENGSAEPWAELLRALHQDGDLATVPPPLPTFPPPESRLGPDHVAPPEDFTVGGQVFPWTPFPPAPRCDARSYHLNWGARGLPGSPTLSPFHRPEPEPHRTPSVKEPPSQPLEEEKPLSMEEEKLLSGKEVPALGCCPMCQLDFSTKLSQLDIDAHLAQCLAESTDDVVW